MDSLQFNYLGRTWKPCPTEADGNCFFNAVFGTRNDTKQPYRDVFAKFRRMYWSTFLTFHSHGNLTGALLGLLRKCFVANDKYQLKTPKNLNDYTEYIQDITSPDYWVLVEEIPLLAALEKIRIVLFVGGRETPEIIEPDPELLGTFPFRSVEGVREVVICLVDNHFARLAIFKQEHAMSKEIPRSTRTKKYMKKGGGGTGMQGYLYRINLLTMVLLNGLKKFDSWRLSTGDENAGRFDDLIFEVLPSESAILLKAKYSRNTKKKITYNDLLSDNFRHNFSIQKYFFSYQEIQIKNKFKVKNIIICTNLDLHDNTKEYLNQESLDVESVLHFWGADNICYSFRRDWRKTSLKDNIKLYGLKRSIPGEVTDDDIDDFLAVLKIFPNYLCDKNFDTVLKETISSLPFTTNMDSKTIFQEIHYKMLDWFREERGSYLTEVQAKGFLDDISSDGSNWSVKEKKLHLVLQQQTGSVSSKSEKMPSSTRKKIYSKKGSAGIEGNLYQINVLTVVLLNALTKVDNWRLSTENADAGCFDDLIFEVPSGSAILLQIRYRKSAHKKITYRELLSDSLKNEFNLSKYFFSYQGIKDNFNVQNIIVCTSMSILDEDAKEYFNREILDAESVLHFTGADNICYSFNDRGSTSLKDDIKLYGWNRHVTDEDIDDFLAVLKFCPNYLRSENFDTVVEETISKLSLSVNMDTKAIFKDIHYKMLDWFNDERGTYLTEIEAKGFFCDIRSNKYCDYLRLYDISFKKKNLPTFLQQRWQIGSDLADAQRISQINPGSELTILNVIKIYQALEPDDLKRALFVNPDDSVDIQQEVVNAFKIPLYTTLVIVCNEALEENAVTEMYDKVTRIINTHFYKHVILIAEENNNLARRFKQSNVDCESITDRITFTDLETITQEIFKQKRCINFQGFMVSIEQLFASWTNHELNQILDSEILAKLARNDEIHVGLELKPLNKYYIHRSFNRDGHNIPEENIYDLDRSTEEKVILISGPAGMGKSTVLASLEFSIKKTNPHLWVVRFDLNTYMDIMEAVLQRGEKCIRMMELLDSHDVSKLESEFEKKLFATPERIVVILDGVDEISPVYTDLVKNLLNDLLLQRNVAKILVTTRPHLCQELEELLNSQSFTLEPFSDQNQIDFLTKYWTKELNLRDDKERTKCRRYTRALIPEMSWWIGDRVGNSFAGIPLQTKMLADVFQQRGGDGVSDWEGCKEFVSSADGTEPKLPERIDLIQLYEMFIDKKREIFIEKSNLGSNLDEVVEENLEKCHSYHRAFALRDIFYSSVWDIFSTNVEWPVPSAFLDNYLLKLGIVQSQAGELHFIHRTFAEYFVATILIEELECEPVSEAFQNFFADHIMLKKEYIVVRAFFDGLIRRALPPLQRKIDDFFNRIAGRIVNSKEFYLHLFAEEGCVAILEVAMHAIESSSVSVDVENGLGETPLHTAARFGHLDAIKCLVKRGAEIRTNKFGQTALHSATCAGNLEIVKYLVSEAGADVTAKDESGTTPLHLAALTDNLEAARFFVDELGADASAENNDGRTALHTAVFEGNLGMVKVCVNQAGADVNVRDGRIRAALRAAVCENNFEIVEFLVEEPGADVAATYECGRSVLHLAASAGNLEIVKLLVKRGASASVRDARGQIPLHAAAFEGNLETVRFLVTLAADVNVEDDDGQTPLRAAASMGKSEIVNFLVDNAGADGNIKGDFITRKKMSFWYSDQRWKQYPTVEDGDSFFHAAFGKTDDNLQPCFDPRAEHRRMHWSTFLTYFEDDTIPSHLKEQLSKCEADQLDGYAEDVMRSEHRIRVEELPILAALMNVRVVLFVRDNEVPEVFESDSHLIENCPLENTAPLVEVVIWFNGVNFVRLQAEKTTARRFKKDPRGKIMEEIIYKINVMTVFLVNGIRKFQNWRLATQREDAGCFDDVIFELSPSETVPTRDTILVQACYNAIKEKITYKNLLEDKIASLRLSQLYFSYMAIKSNYRIKNVVLCTNADLDLMKKLGGLVNRERLNETSIFHYEGVESWCYTFNENIIPALEKSLQRSPRKRERDIISKENIRQFLNYLQIITLYPSNGSFDKIIENLISSVGYIKKLDVKDFSQYLNAKIIDWFEEGRGRHLAEVDAKAIMCGYRSKKFCDKLHDIKINFTTDTLVFDRVKRILHIVPDKEFILNLIKVYWFLYRNKIKTLFVHPDDPIFIQKKMIEALEAPEYTHLVICVDNIMNDDKAIRECCEKITSILTRCIEKRLILIADEDNKFAKHIETENRHLYRMSSDSISFADLTEESQEKLLEDLVTIFEANM